MPINLNKLPNIKPVTEFTLPEPGFHLATIEGADIKTSKNGNDYINLKFKLDSGAIVWDILPISETPLMQYKLARLLKACKIPISGVIELKDLTRTLLNKRLVIHLKHETDNYQGNERTLAKVDLFAGDIFYTPEELPELVGQKQDNTEQSTIFDPSQY